MLRRRPRATKIGTIKNRPLARLALPKANGPLLIAAWDASITLWDPATEKVTHRMSPGGIPSQSTQASRLRRFSSSSSRAHELLILARMGDEDFLRSGGLLVRGRWWHRILLQVREQPLRLAFSQREEGQATCLETPGELVATRVLPNQPDKRQSSVFRAFSNGSGMLGSDSSSDSGFAAFEGPAWKDEPLERR